MKRFFSLGLIAMVLAAFTFTSCSKDDEEPANVLVGKWKATSIESSIGSSSMTMNGILVSFVTAEFTNGGKAVLCGLEDDASGTYSITGDNTVTITIAGVQMKYTFTVTGDTLVLEREYYLDQSTDTEYETEPENVSTVKAKEKTTYKRS